MPAGKRKRAASTADAGNKKSRRTSARGAGTKAKKVVATTRTSRRGRGGRSKKEDMDVEEEEESAEDEEDDEVKKDKVNGKGSSNSRKKSTQESMDEESMDVESNGGKSKGSSSKNKVSTTTTTTSSSSSKKGEKDEEYEKASDAEEEAQDKEDDDDMSGEEEDISESEDEQVVKVLPKRGTRGRRFNQLIGEEKEADQAFWGQKAWGDDQDEDYVYEKQKDIVDSDFDDSEDSSDEEVEEVTSRRKKKSGKTGRYQDPAFKRNKGKQSQNVKKVRRPRLPVAPVVQRQRVFRESTKLRKKQSESIRKSMREKAVARNSNRTIAAPVRQLTQEELLRAASYTEMENKRKLEVMLQFQVDKRARAAPKAPYSGPLVRYHSSKKYGTLYTFTEVSEVPSVINSKPIAYPKRPVCAVTGMPAKYRDPKTGLYYSNLEAFRSIRAGNVPTPGNEGARSDRMMMG